MDKEAFLDNIDSNIKRHGYHLTTVLGGPNPRYSYTIGLTKIIGHEFIFAGNGNLALDDITSIINTFYQNALGKLNTRGSIINSFNEIIVDDSWARILMLGVSDYYKTDIIKAHQIVPFRDKTMDVPDLSSKANPILEPAWKWLFIDWPFNISPNSIVITNINSLHGEKVTEVTRWETDEWEAFVGAGPEVDKNSICIVPLGTLLGIDDSLELVTTLEIGSGVWREPNELIWNEWR